MNLNELNTVNELLEANEAPVPEKQDADSLYQLALATLDSENATKLATLLVEQLAVHHQNVRNELTEAGDAERSALWAHDEALLACALTALKSVTLD